MEHAKQEQELEGWRKAEAEWRAEQKQVMAKLKVRWGGSGLVRC